jgi:hypothetical protein
VAKRVIEPVKNASIRETISAALAVSTGTLCGCETDHGLRTGEVLIKYVRLALQVHILFGIENQVSGVNYFFGWTTTISPGRRQL